jgi:hypothetical protein
VSLADRLFGALKTAIQLDERVQLMADKVNLLAREVREIDKRLVRIETIIEIGGVTARPPGIRDERS